MKIIYNSHTFLSLKGKVLQNFPNFNYIYYILLTKSIYKFVISLNYLLKCKMLQHFLNFYFFFMARIKKIFRLFFVTLSFNGKT